MAKEGRGGEIGSDNEERIDIDAYASEKKRKKEKTTDKNQSNSSMKIIQGTCK